MCKKRKIDLRMIVIMAIRFTRKGEKIIKGLIVKFKIMNVNVLNY